MTKASLIIPSYAGAARLPVVLEALKHQTHDDWEALVVIDGEIDDSAAVVASYATELPVRAIVLPTNRGRVTALNTGFAAAAGDVLIRCDDDFEPSPRHIAAHVAAHGQAPCGAVGLPLNIAPDNAYMRAYGYDADMRGREDSYALAADQRWRIWGGNTSISREVYAAVGDFDDRYRGYGWEDLDYGYRIHAAGFPIELVRDAEVRHHMASISTRIRAERAYRSGSARRTFEELHGVGSWGEVPDPSSVWDLAVALLSRALNLNVTGLAASAIDRTIPFVPAAVGRKLVALAVEAAVLSGYRKGLTS